MADQNKTVVKPVVRIARSTASENSNATEEQELEQEQETQVPEIPRASIKKTDEDMVHIVALRDMNPAPVMGDISFMSDLNIPRLEKNASYRIPRRCALILAEAKHAVIAAG